LACVDQGKDAENKSLLKRFFKIDLLLYYYDLIFSQLSKIMQPSPEDGKQRHKIQIVYDQIIIKKLFN